MAKAKTIVKDFGKDLFTFDKEFDHLFKSIPGIIWCDTLEEERFIDDVMDDIRKIVISAEGQTVERKQNIPVWIWSATSGLQCVSESIDPFLDVQVDQDTTNPIKAIDTLESLKCGPNPAIFIMRGLSELLKVQPIIARKLKDIYKSLYKSNKIIIITANNAEIPLSLDKNITYYNYKTMDREKITKLINDKLEILRNLTADTKSNIKIDYTPAELNDIINACLGLSANEIRKILNMELNKNKEIHVCNIIKEKKRAIEKSGVLEYWESLESMDNVGGLDLLKDWLRKRKNCLSEEALKFGLPTPRGTLIVGVPGCGKSLCAKATASAWGLPLIRIDVGKLMGGIVGASEANMRKALDVLDSNAPCCAWLDEIEKNLSGSASSNYSDSGTLSRVFGTFTTWLQEKKSYVFVIATANDISQLPPELTRKGRLDEIWYVGLPTEKERKEIFNIQLKKYNRDPKSIDIDRLAKIVHNDPKKPNKIYNYTGAEIEEAIKDALYTVFDRDPKSDIKTEDIELSLKQLVPISMSEEERINKIIAEGQKHYRAASSDIDIVKMVEKDVDINL